MRCKRKQEVNWEGEVPTKKGTVRKYGKCRSCGTKVSLFAKSGGGSSSGGPKVLLPTKSEGGKMTHPPGWMLKS